ncbi:MAG: hypothetical protein EOO77_05355 [Oxalobacteraceae bacterium]|nr:MAG: hypothetical protein EOO77_05355 [Oxalobacteraceae bacterium]
MKLIEVIGAPIGAAVGVLVWVYNTFQTKTEGLREREVVEHRLEKVKEDMQRSEQIFQDKIDDLKGEVAGVHNDMRAFRGEVRSEFGVIRSDLHGIRTEYFGIAKDLTYIKGRLEPK